MTPGSPREGERIRLALDEAGWRFTPGRSGAAGGESVILPHCWNAADEYRSGVDVRRGLAAYQLDFDLPEPGAASEWRLRSGGFYGVGEAWLNGQSIGRFNGDYLGLDLDVTAALRPKENRLVVKVSNRYLPHVLPGLRDPDFHLYGGLGGGMHLEALPPVRLVRADSRVLPDESLPGEVSIELALQNHGDSAAAVSCQVVLRDSAGVPVAEGEGSEDMLPAGASACQLLRCVIPSPRLWSPDSPALYTVEAALRRDGRVVDRLAWSFGLRTVHFDAGKSLLINGSPVVLRGVNRHENLPGFGFAMPAALHEADARRIKELGLNFVRLSHYPQSPAFLDACDRLGLLVLAELCSWKRIRGGRWQAAAAAQLDRMIRRDRHHPSVLLWGLGNEGRHRGVYRQLHALARSLDPSRLTLYAENHAYRARREKTAGLTEVWGLNYEFEELDYARSAAPTGCVVVTECANLPFARRGHLPAEARQLAMVRDAVQRVESAGAGAVGWALWDFADYATPRRQRWFRECGVLDGARVPKMAADWLRARLHSDEPFLRVRADWSASAGLRRRLYIVTNCPDLRILRADGSVRELSVPSADGGMEVDVDFDNAPLRIEGRHPAGTVAHRLDPWETPAAFELSGEAVSGSDPGARSLYACTLQVRDARGAAVLSFEGEATVRVPAGCRASLIGGRTVPVHGGRGRFYVETPRGAAAVLEGRLGEFPPQTLRLGGEGAP